MSTRKVIFVDFRHRTWTKRLVPCPCGHAHKFHTNCRALTRPNDVRGRGGCAVKLCPCRVSREQLQKTEPDWMKL